MKLKELVPGVLVLTVLAGCDPGNDPLSSVTSMDEVTAEKDAVPPPLGIVAVFVKSDFSAVEGIVGFGWEPGTDATLTLPDVDNGGAAYSCTSIVNASGEARFQDCQPPVPFADIDEGDRVTITGTGGPATHVVQYLAFGWVDFAADKVCGYAGSGAFVSVRAFTSFPIGVDVELNAGTNGAWCADFAMKAFDLRPGDWGWAVTPNGPGHTQLHWYTPLALPVPVDIRPSGDPNSLNCHALAQVVTVAILTVDDFDATTVDHTTVTFEGASETHVNARTGEPRRHEEDVDEDGDMDLVFHFRLGDTGLACDATEGTLTGQLFNGTPIVGTDAIGMIG